MGNINLSKTCRGGSKYLTPAGQYTGSKVTYFGGLASFLAISGRAFGNQTVIGRSISCSSDEYGAFVVRTAHIPLEHNLCTLYVAMFETGDPLGWYHDVSI